MRLPRPTALRARLPLIVVGLVALALGIALVAFNFSLSRALSNDATHLARSRAEARAASLDVKSGRLVVDFEDAAAGSPLWIFRPDGGLVGPGTGIEIDRKARALAAAGGGYIDVEPEDLRLVGAPIQLKGKTWGTVVGAASIAPYERTRRIALFASGGLALALLVVIAVATRWTVGAALRPVARMTRDAEEWSDHDIDRRFDLGPARDELTRLAATLDDLLARLAASHRREQRLTAELSHELRTPLSKIITQAELALRREREPSDYTERIESMLDNARDLARTMETLLAAARQDADGRGGSCDSQSVVAAVLRQCEPLAEERGVRLEQRDVPEPIAIAVESALAERILHPIVDNACRYAAGEVVVSVGAENGTVTIRTRDDGPGVSVAERDLVFEPGARGSVGREMDASGAGLGLALARRLARTAGGDVTLGDGPGTCFEVRLAGVRVASPPPSHA